MSGSPHNAKRRRLRRVFTVYKKKERRRSLFHPRSLSLVLACNSQPGATCPGINGFTDALGRARSELALCVRADENGSKGAAKY
jgi:hypothetical protein